MGIRHDMKLEEKVGILDMPKHILHTIPPSNPAENLCGLFKGSSGEKAVQLFVRVEGLRRTLLILTLDVTPPADQALRPSTVTLKKNMLNTWRQRLQAVAIALRLGTGDLLDIVAVTPGSGCG
ncbi:hypothetical protein HG530_010244 [Fusarium avenaceum]|nr:hypothetical protein HG530_010244 [Fusarium avenaceum]